LNFIDVDGRVVPRSERKRDTANNQLQCVASVGRERDLSRSAATLAVRLPRNPGSQHRAANTASGLIFVPAQKGGWLLSKKRKEEKKRPTHSEHSLTMPQLTFHGSPLAFAGNGLNG
jgi:hypothetical protein